MKVCSKCKTEKEFAEFYKHTLGKHGLAANCKACYLASQKKYHDRIKPIRKEKAKLYYLENKAEIDNRNAVYRKKHKDRPAINSHYKRNKARLIRQGNEYRKNRCAIDPLYKMRLRLRARTKSAFKGKGINKAMSTETLLGVSFSIAKKHIEKQFLLGMTWENYGCWHIDHKIPLASAKTEEELIALCHYRNLQPLWAKDNLAKSDKIYHLQTSLQI